MRKLLAALIAITLISIPVSAQAAIKPGSTCPTISKTATVGKVSYTCAKQGTRKVWLQTIRVGAPCKKAGVSAIVLKKKYLCTAKGKSRTWSLIKIADANQPDKSPAPSSIEASINIIYDEVSAKNNIPVTIERIDPVGTNAVKSFKRELTKSASLTSLLPGSYELTLGIEKIDVAQGSYLGMLSSSVILLSKGESRSAEVNFSTLMPKSTHAVSKTDYTEFKELSDGAIQFKSASLSNQDIKVNEYLILPPSSELESGYIGKVMSKSADTFLGSHDVPVTRGVDIVKRECVFDRPVDSVSISMTVTVRDITAAQEYRSGLPAANAANAPPPSGNKPGGDATFIPMLSIDDVLETNEAQVFEPYFPWLFASPPSRPTQATASRTSPKILLLNSTLPATTSKN